MEQGNVAKKLTGQILENWLLTLADGHGGIQTITKTGTSGLVDTYTIAFADETTSTFTVTNGRSISGLTTSKSGKVTTITITYNDNTTSSFTVRDGENVSSITEYWAVSTSGSQQPQSGWQTTPPTLTATYKYLWHYSKYTFSDGTNTSTTPAVQGVYGDKGDTGNTGTSITSVTKTGTSGLVDTYTITFSNGTTTTFNVTNGSEIESIEKTSTAGLVDTYTVTMGSGDTHTFTVTNGRSIVSFTQTSGTHAAGTIDVYTMTYNDGDTSQIQVYNGANGTGAVSTVAGIGVSSADGDVPLIIKGYGAPTTATVGQVNQLYFDMTGGIMYICISTTGGSYDWRGMSSAVDSAMSTTSANPLQNRVISNKVGVGSLSTDFAATNLTDAANELQTNKANLASPTFTGTPKAPTAAAGTNNTQLATTAFVQNIASDLNGAITSFNKASKSRKFVVISDSYGVGTTAGGTTTGWTENFRTYLGLTANTNLFSSAVGGSGFVGGSGIATFNDQLNTIYGSISNVADTITDVIFAGGYNDSGYAYYDNGLSTAITQAITNAKSKFPNAKIWVFCIGYSTADSNTQRNDLISTRILYEDQASKNGATYADVSKVLRMYASWMSSDTIHPTADGYKEIGANIANFVQGGTVRTGYKQQTATITGATNITVNPNTVLMQVFNDNLIIFANTLALDRFQFPAGTLSNGPNWTELGTLSNSLIHGTSNLSYFPVTGFLFNGTYEEFQGFIRFESNKIYLLVRNIKNGVYEDLSTVTRVTIDFFGIKTPIDIC